MKLAIRKHWVDFLAIFGLAVIGLGVTVYLLSQQDFRFPLVEKTPKKIEIELANAQAVQPGQGQTVRVAGVEVGRIADVKLEEGQAVVTLEIKPGNENLIRRDATALLRPKTALKDMFVEVDPGNGKPVPEGGRITVANSLPDIDPDEIYAALDADTRPYLKLLIAGAGKGLDQRGDDLREVFRRFEPIHRDIARVTRASARRRAALKELIHDYGLLMTEVGSHPQELRRLVNSSHVVFDALAADQSEISEAVARLPGSLRASERALRNVREFAPVLRSSLQSLRKPIGKLDETNQAVIPFLRETQPVIRDQIRPFVRAARPWTNDLRLAAAGTAKATPDLRRSFGELNRFFNIGAYNPGGAEGLDGKSISQQRQRQEGLLYWLAWTAQNGTSLFSSADGQGPWRRVTICGVPAAVLTGIVQGVANDLADSNPALADLLLNPGPGGSSPVDQLLATQFGSCNFNALPTAPPPGSGGGLPILGDLPLPLP
ncbi:MAG: phospholipid/cholesterol/gamma-HCH transport system substrate-binding protein [Thermoleophilaceae bacterium]|nr:phospholipid/cholesterol/gamma-HCH transport system substrate-binding protein [Thermoleophilaceae bacterium]